MDGMTLPADNKTGPNCGVTSVALAAGITFQQAWNELAVHRKSKKWKGATNDFERRAVLEKLGVKFKELKLAKGCSLKTFVNHHTSKGKLYMVHTTTHVQMVKDGMVTDQGGTKPIALSGWRARKRVKHVLLIGE